VSRATYVCTDMQTAATAGLVRPLWDPAATSDTQKQRWKIKAGFVAEERASQ